MANVLANNSQRYLLNPADTEKRPAAAIFLTTLHLHFSIHCKVRRGGHVFVG